MAITCNEFSHNTQPNNFESLNSLITRYILHRVFLGKTLVIYRSAMMKKFNMEGLCKQNRFVVGTLCKCLQNFVNMAAQE